MEAFKGVLPGLKTKITAWVMALAPAAAMLGYDINPEAVADFIEQFSGWIAAGYALLGAAAHYFRNLAGK